ncbi:DUF2637 domain-containing protein [Streptomyces alfalfae]|uniref:DUF2637 domain-containing protein n=1 Tax=Streptomyces alfalfae TaxID=1642299 RepID=A0ABN4VE21_9ACTN|nr:DUF2637 domain-containing protein [Streptomyces alfalfae]APY85711.1 hypothetical protein A7J05_08285 [Streptomyces alfalfae]AYA16069.1 DUF2637 domain-containing protein [Streptomyces fradiae]RXX39541.1 DUF2637 domain-containing protein [Streptomyces alfalfae]RZM94034.1 DUF2637 domain-containing protein [Streptomyces alfalfae]
MRLTDISLDWLLPGGVLLLGMLVAVAVLARGKRGHAKADKDTSGADSWERSEERRRRKEAIYGSASYVLLFCCAAVAAALSFHGLVGFGRQNLSLSGGWEYLVPFGLDGAAMFCSVLAVREASHGDAALGSRLLVWTFAGAAAWFNWVHAPRGLGHAGAPQFFAGMSLSAAVLFDRALKQTRRAALREQGLVPRPLPQIRIVRWLRAPRETFGAWSLMLLEGVRSLDEAVEEVREDRREKQRTRMHRRDKEKLERAQLKAISRGQRGYARGGRQVDVQAVPSGAGPAQVGADPAIAGQEQLPSRARPSLQAVKGDPDAAPVTVDLTAEDDTQALPRLDSLERKLKDLEQQFG